MKKYLCIILSILFIVSLANNCYAWDFFGSSQPKFLGFQLGEKFDTSKGEEEVGGISRSEIADTVDGAEYYIKRDEYKAFLDFSRPTVIVAKDGTIVSISISYSGSKYVNNAFNKACESIEANFNVSAEGSGKDRIYYIDRSEKTYFRVTMLDMGFSGNVRVTLHSDKLIQNARKAKAGTSAFW